MKKWILTVLVAGTSLSVSANPGVCGPSTGITARLCDLGGGTFEVFGYALWLRPSTCSHKFVIPDPTYGERLKKSQPQDATLNNSTGYLPPRTKGTGLGECPEYDWGFRIGLGYVSCDGCKDVRISYSRLHATDNEFVKIKDGCDGGALWPTYVPAQSLEWCNDLQDGAAKVLVNPQTAKTLDTLGTRAKATLRSRFKWDSVDAEFAGRMCKAGKMFVRGHIGLQWAELRAEHHIHYQGTILALSNTDSMGTSAFMTAKIAPHTWGVGPRIGVDARYQVFCGLGITARVGAAVLAGEQRFRKFVKTKVQTKILDGITAKAGEAGATTSVNATLQASPDCKEADFSVKHPDECTVFPEIEAALGISYENNWGTCCCFIAEVGYEFRSYINALTGATFSDPRSAVTAASCDSFNLQGLYFGVLLRL